MRKNNKITMTILLAVIFAIAAGVGIFSLLSPKFTTYYIFNSTYKAGTPLTSEMLTPIEAPSTIVVAGANVDGNTRLVTTQNLRNILTSGDSLKMDVSEGMPLMQSMLSVTGGSTIEMIMSPSKIAMTVSVSDVTGVTDELTSGSSVNVYIMSEDSSYLLFENMRLLAVNRNENGSLVSATLELTNAQAKALLNAQTMGSVYFGLVNSGGYVYELPNQTETTTTQEIPSEESTEAVEATGIPETETPVDTEIQEETEQPQTEEMQVPEPQTEQPETDTQTNEIQEIGIVQQ